MKDKQTALEERLQEWRVTTPLPPRFREQVWQRIEHTETPGVSLADAWRAWVAATFARPAFAVAYITVLLIVGFVFGVMQATNKTARWDRQLEARYVQAIDPYQRGH